MEENERAGELARYGSTRTYTRLKPFCGIGIATVKNNMQDLLNLEHQKIWPNLKDVWRSQTILYSYHHHTSS